ncbi:MAG TPA: MASE4 domain-containing protein [Caulobacteraceae bacterium]|jgi:signal transduction histidine kinase|nr:MASE4 domain-containing protein [Caulobacteraceae bacterium]
MAYAQPSASSALATAPAGPAQRRVAMWVGIACVVALVAIIPIARLPAPRAPGFIAAYEGAAWLENALTAALLLGQFARLKTRALLLVIAAYAFGSVMAIVHALSFPGAIAPQGLLGGGPQATSWLYVLWHAGFPALLVAYALAARTSWGRTGARRPAASASLFIGLGLAAALAGTAWTIITGDRLPPIVVRDAYAYGVSFRVSPGMLLLTLATLGLLWRGRTATRLDLWLMVVVAIWFCEVSLSAFASNGRYQVGWYAGRVFGALAAGFVLAMLIIETLQLYGNLAAALDHAEAQNRALAASQAELAKAQRLEAIGRFTGGIAHDFNNLLTAIIGGLDLIVRKPDDPDRVARLGRNALEAARRGARLIAQIQSFALRRNLHPQPADPGDLLRGLAPVLEQLAGTDVELRVSAPDGLPQVVVDTGEFEAAVLNLVSNARDALAGCEPRRRLIEVSAEAEGDVVCVRVRDHGAGMDEETVSRAFEPFYTTKPVGKGTGLGLSQAYGFAQGAGGEARILSRPASGTVVELRLPAAREPVALVPAARPQPETGGTGSRILAVDDDPAVLEALTEALRDLGYAVSTADGPADALARLEASTPFDLLLTDIVMTGDVDGYALATRARALRPGLKVLMATGHPPAAAALEAPVLAKPYTRESLATALAAALAEAPERADA